MFFRSFVGKHGLIAVFGIDILRGGRDAWHKKSGTVKSYAQICLQTPAE